MALNPWWPLPTLTVQPFDYQYGGWRSRKMLECYERLHLDPLLLYKGLGQLPTNTGRDQYDPPCTFYGSGSAEGEVGASQIPGGSCKVGHFSHCHQAGPWLIPAIRSAVCWQQGISATCAPARCLGWSEEDRKLFLYRCAGAWEYPNYARERASGITVEMTERTPSIIEAGHGRLYFFSPYHASQIR